MIKEKDPDCHTFNYKCACKFIESRKIFISYIEFLVVFLLQIVGHKNIELKIKWVHDFFYELSKDYN